MSFGLNCCIIMRKEQRQFVLMMQLHLLIKTLCVLFIHLIIYLVFMVVSVLWYNGKAERHECFICSCTLFPLSVRNTCPLGPTRICFIVVPWHWHTLQLNRASTQQYSEIQRVTCILICLNFFCKCIIILVYVESATVLFWIIVTHFS